MPTYAGFVGPSGQSQSPVADMERTVNLYVEPSDVGSGRPALYPTPGMNGPFVTVSDVGGRALRQMNNTTLAVMGGQAYSVASTMSAAKLFAVTQDQNLAQIEFNGVIGNQALFASGTNGYVYNLGSGANSQVLTGDAYQIGMLDGYFIAFSPTNGHIRISALNDGTSWDPTQFAGRSTQPDTWKAMIVRPPDIILIGDLSGDIWFDAGNFPFPFAPRAGFTFYYGIAAPFSLARAGGTVMWLSKTQEGSGLLVKMEGYAAQPIGSYAFDAAVAGYQRTSTITDAEGTMIQWFGHTWYVLRFPSANHTWAYDLRTGLFFEVGHWDSKVGDYDIWSPRVHCLSFGLHLVADTSGNISYLDDSIGTEANGDPIRRLRVPPALIAQNGSRVFVDRFELGIQPGVGSALGQGSDPHVMVRWSKDFGRTYGNEIQLAIGQQGQFGKRVYHMSAGSSLKSMVPEVTMTDPVPCRIVGASVIGRGIATTRQGGAAA